MNFRFPSSYKWTLLRRFIDVSLYYHGFRLHASCSLFLKQPVLFQMSYLISRIVVRMHPHICRVCHVGYAQQDSISHQELQVIQQWFPSITTSGLRAHCANIAQIGLFPAYGLERNHGKNPDVMSRLVQIRIYMVSRWLWEECPKRKKALPTTQHFSPPTCMSVQKHKPACR